MGRWDAALEAYARAIQLDPDAAWLVAPRVGDVEGRKARRGRDPRCTGDCDGPAGDWWWTHRVGCEAHLLLGQYDEAISACEKATGLTGDEFIIANFLAAAYAHKGFDREGRGGERQDLAQVPRFYHRDAEGQAVFDAP